MPTIFKLRMRPGARRLTMDPRLILAVWMAVASSLFGCAAQAKVTGTKVSYSATSRQNYKKGKKALKSKNFEDAMKYFKFVKARYPFSKYATLAELRIADVMRDAEKFIACIDAYKTFIKEHPTHPMWVAVGTPGSSFSQDQGATWHDFDTHSFNSVAFAGSAGWAAGAQGQVARLVVH